jgi:hypothetical protein
MLIIIVPIVQGRRRPFIIALTVGVVVCFSQGSQSVMAYHPPAMTAVFYTEQWQILAVIADAVCRCIVYCVFEVLVIYRQITTL